LEFEICSLGFSSPMKYLLFSTTKGLVKKTSLEEYASIRRSGLVAIRLDSGDQLLAVRPTSGKDLIMLVTAHGKAIKFKETDIRPTGRATRGVRGIKIKKGDQVVSMQVIGKQKNEASPIPDQLLVVTEHGFGKRTSLLEYSTQGRGGQGVFTAKINEKTGKIVNAHLVAGCDNQSDLLIISKAGKIIRLPLSQVPQLGRHTQGVRLFRLDPGDAVASLTLL